jgi:hypothetical protein
LAGINSSPARSRFRPNRRHPIDFTPSVRSPAPTGKFCQERIRATGSPTTISLLSSFTLAITEVIERAQLPWLTLSYSDAITNRGFKFLPA